MWNADEWMEEHGEEPFDKNYHEEYWCVVCGEFFEHELNRVRKQYVCDDCLRKEEYDEK